MRRENRAPSSAWFVRMPKPDRYPNGYVRTSNDDEIQVIWFEDVDNPRCITLDHWSARLLAKRINQCLDGTALR